MDMSKRVELSHPDDLTRWSTTAEQLERAAKIYRQISTLNGINELPNGMDINITYGSFFAEMIASLMADWDG